MSRIYADIEALKALRQALLTFAARQHDTLQEAEAEIARTQAALHEAEQHWRYEVERRRAELEQCMLQAMRAAQEGYAVDCSGYAYALQSAEEQLTRLIQWQRRVEEAVTQYRSVAQAFASLLQELLPRATSYLADRITALEAYYAMRVMETATALARSGISGTMGGVIAAVRHSKGELSRVMGGVGEQVTAHVLSEKFGLEEIPFDQPKHGFDRVFRAPGMPLIVVESKVSSSGELHLGQTQAGEQGSPSWIAAEAARMAERGSAQWSPANERIAALVQELGAENVPTLAVVVNPTTNQADLYARVAAEWQPLRSGISLSDALQRPGPGPQTPPEFREGTPGGPERGG